MTNKTLYPIGKLIRSGQIAVTGDASLYYEERGNPNGPVVVYNHGGPGGSARPETSQWFDPNYYHIIIYDQRGTGRSQPSVRDNKVRADYFRNLTIDDMANDLETLRKTLNIKKWLVFGGSWGSTLSLYYSEKYPQNVSGLIVYGIFLNSKPEMDEYFNINFMRKRFPELGELAMQELLNYAQSKSFTIDPHNAKSFVQTYFDLCVLQDDPIAQYLWMTYEEFNDDPTKESLNKLKVRPSRQDLNGVYRSIAIFESTMFRFAVDGFNLLDEKLLQQLKNINTYIIQGKDDTEAPPTYAQALVDALLKIKPDLHYQFVEGRHDGGSSPEMTTALIESTDAFKNQPLKSEQLLPQQQAQQGQQGQQADEAPRMSAGQDIQKTKEAQDTMQVLEAEQEAEHPQAAEKAQEADVEQMQGVQQATSKKLLAPESRLFQTADKASISGSEELDILCDKRNSLSQGPTS